MVVGREKCRTVRNVRNVVGAAALDQQQPVTHWKPSSFWKERAQIFVMLIIDESKDNGESSK